MFNPESSQKKRQSIEKNHKQDATNRMHTTIFLRNLIRNQSISTNSINHRETEGNINDDFIIKSFRYIESDKCTNKIDFNILKHAIYEMRKGSYGVIDLNNDQHLELLYCHISDISKRLLKDSQPPSQEQVMEGENEKWQKEKLSSPDVQNTYKTAFIGAGASIAYYIESLGKNFDHGESIIIGLPQPWGGERGPGVIDHPEHMITPKRQFCGATEITDQWPSRRLFSQLLEDVFEKSGIKSEMGRIIKIEKIDGFYCIKYTQGEKKQVIYAKEVIFGMGAGKHASRVIDQNHVAKTDADVETKKSRIMNMDIFSRVANTLENENRRKEIIIIIVGGNAAIDTVFDALKKGYKVKWIPGKSGVDFSSGFPNYVAYLPYLKYLSSIEKNIKRKSMYNQEIKKINESNVLKDLYCSQDEKYFKGIIEDFSKKEFDCIKSISLEHAEQIDGGVIAKLENGEEIKGDYLVYAIGSDGASLALLDENIQKNLVPDTDLNRRFKQRDNRNQTILGLKTTNDATGSSLKIIGAAAARMMASTRVQQTLDNVCNSLPHTVFVGTQLTPIRSQIEAANNFMPYDIHERANFITDDRTMIATHISAKYPALADHTSPVSAMGAETDRKSSARFVELLTEMIIRSRRQQGMKSKPASLLPDGPDVLPYPPNGHAFQEYWEKMLSKLEKSIITQKREIILSRL